MDIKVTGRAEVIFTLTYYLLPLFLGWAHTLIRGGKIREAILYYYLLLGIGIQGLITGFAQAFMPEMVANFAGWPASPFTVELGLANISFGLLGLISLFKDRSWQTASLVGYSIFLLLTGTRHVVEIFTHGVTDGNLGAFALVDFLMPVTILTLLLMPGTSLGSPADAPSPPRRNSPRPPSSE